MNLFKKLSGNISFLLICLLFGSLTLIVLNAGTGDSTPPDRPSQDIVFVANHDYSPVFSLADMVSVPEVATDIGTPNVSNNNYAVYNPAIHDKLLKARSGLVYYQDADANDSAIATPNPKDIIEGIKGAESWTDLLGYESAIYTLIILIGGWLSAFIPGLKSINSGVYRVLVFAILVIAGGLVLGFGNVWQGAIAYFFSTSMYEIFLKKAIPTPKPDEVK